MKRKFFIALVALGALFVLSAALYVWVVRTTPTAPKREQGVPAIPESNGDYAWQTFSSKFGYSFSYPPFLGGGAQALQPEARRLGLFEITSFKSFRGAPQNINITVTVERLPSATTTLGDLVAGYEAGAKQAGIVLTTKESKQSAQGSVDFIEHHYTSDKSQAKYIATRQWISGEKVYIFVISYADDTLATRITRDRIFASLRLAL